MSLGDCLQGSETHLRYCCFVCYHPSAQLWEWTVSRFKKWGGTFLKQALKAGDDLPDTALTMSPKKLLSFSEPHSPCLRARVNSVTHLTGFIGALMTHVEQLMERYERVQRIHFDKDLCV